MNLPAALLSRVFRHSSAVVAVAVVLGLLGWWGHSRLPGWAGAAAGALGGALAISLLAAGLKNVEQRIQARNAALDRALVEMVRLHEFLPICASCRCARDDTGRWHRIDTLLHVHPEIRLSHGLCPECARRLYPELKTVVETQR